MNEDRRELRKQRKSERRTIRRPVEQENLKRAMDLMQAFADEVAPDWNTSMPSYREARDTVMRALNALRAWVDDPDDGGHGR